MYWANKDYKITALGRWRGWPGFNTGSGELYCGITWVFQLCAHEAFIKKETGRANVDLANLCPQSLAGPRAGTNTVTDHFCYETHRCLGASLLGKCHSQFQIKDRQISRWPVPGQGVLWMSAIPPTTTALLTASPPLVTIEFQSVRYY